MKRIQSLKLNNFRFFTEENNLFEFDGESALIYGENGSGKSSIYRALGLLAKDEINQAEFENDKNIFNSDGDEFVEFVFDDGGELRIDSDHLDFVGFESVSKISIYKPFLDYKKLLKIHYNTNGKRINLFEMFEVLLENYPLDESGKKLKYIKDDIEQYLKNLEEIVKTLEEQIKRFLSEISDKKLKLNKIDISILARTIYLDMEFYDEKITTYHEFLNEARLSALAMSVYFASIVQLSKLLGDDDLRILVLDDLLISLDMGNRMRLVPLFQNEFQDFQILFLTHDKALFEIYKEKLGWRGFEIYLDDSGEFEKPLLKISSSSFDKALEHFALKQYDCTANFLRKACEGILSKWLDKEAYNANCEKLQLNDLIQNGIKKSDGELKELLQKLQTYRKTILNPQSHFDDTPIYMQELKSAIEDVKRLKEKLV